MITDLIITDLTNMHADRICVAAVDNHSRSIRPLFRNRHLFRNWCNQGNQTIQPFSRIQVDLIEHRSQPPHTEDWIMADNYLRVQGVLADREKRPLIESTLSPNVASIFGTPIMQVERAGTFVASGQGFRSLGTVLVNNVGKFSHAYYEGHRDYRVSFSDQSGTQYRLKIVDLTFQAYVDHLFNLQNENDDLEGRINQLFRHRDIFFRIGLARNWGKFPDRCYLQITGVYAFPDYLHGRCFADFQ